MSYIIITIILSVLLLVIFKLFDVFKVNSLVAIIFNYVTACLTGIIFYDGPPLHLAIGEKAWLLWCIPLSAVFILVFYMIGKTAQHFSMSTASVANKMSVVIPVLFSFVILHEQPNLIRLAGILLALAAVYLSTKGAGKTSTSSRLLWMPLIVFFGSGLIDTSINAVNSFYIKSSYESALFSIGTFACAFVLGMLILLFLTVRKTHGQSELLSAKNIVAGLILGIPNYFSIYYIFLSLESKVLSSAQLFPVLNVSNVALAAITGMLIFKEKLSGAKIAGLVLAIISIILIFI